MPRLASRIAVAIAVVAFLALTLSVLLKPAPRYAGTNSVRPLSIVHGLAPRETLCQKGELVPARAATIEVSVSTAGQPGPPLVAELRTTGGRVLARGRVRGGYHDGVVGVPIPVVRGTLAKVDVCLRETARGTAQIYGQVNAERKLEVNRKPIRGVLRLGYRRPGEETWLGIAPTVAHRFAQAKTRVATPFTFWALLVLVLGVAGLAVRAVLTDDEEDEVVA